MDHAAPKEPRLGRVVRGFARIMMRVYYPRFEIEGADQLPTDRPVLLCANHPNSLLDPVLVGYASCRPVRFFAKAPLFETFFLGAVMKALGMIPAYRGSDDRDRETIRRNIESLKHGIALLVEGHTVGIFPEGKSHDNTRVEMVRGGAARMALDAVKAGATRLSVVPVSLNYEQKERFRSGVWVRVAPPIQMDEWLAQHGQTEANDRMLARKLTGELEQRLTQVTIHLNSADWQHWLESLEVLATELPVTQPTRVPELVKRKQIADAINAAVERDQPGAEAVARAIEHHAKRASACGLALRAEVLRCPLSTVAWRTLTRTVLFLVLAIPGILGLVTHLIPFWIVRIAAQKVTPPGRTAMSFYKLLIGLPVYVVWYLLIGFLIRNHVNLPTLVAITTGLPLLGLIGLRIWQRGGATLGELWYTVRAFGNRKKLYELREQRQQLSRRLLEMARL